MKTAAEGSGGGVVRSVRLRAIVFLVLTLLAGVLAIVLVRVSLLKARQRAGEAVRTVQVVVAAIDVPVATKLEARHVKAVAWPADTVPAGSFRRVNQVVGRSATQAFVVGEPVLRPRLAGSEKGVGLAALLRAGHRAMSVKVDQVIGIAGFIQTGDVVDVLTIMAPDEATQTGLSGEISRVGKIILQNVKVLAVGEQLQTTGNQTNRVTVVTLEVDPAQSERLALASQHGAIQLTMRSRLDQETVPTLGVTPAMLLLPDEAAAEAAGALLRLSPLVATRTQPVARPGGVRRPPVGRPQTPVSAPPPPDRPPVVEILRPGRVEERQLRPPSGNP